MGLLFIDGFNHYSAALLGYKWDDDSGTVNIDTSPVRIGQGAFRTGISGAYIRKTITGNPTTLVVGFSLRVGAINPAYSLTTYQNIVSMKDVAHLEQLTLQWRPCEKVMRVIGGLDSAPGWTSSTTSKISLGQGYYFVELKRVIGGTPSWVLRIDGVTVLSGNDDVATQGAGDVSWVYLGDGQTDMSFDDVYMLDGAVDYPAGGSKNTDLLGPCGVYTLWPIGNGPDADWVGSDGNSTNNYLLVDDNLDAVGTPDGDATYVTSGASGARDTYQPGTGLPSGQAVFGVQTVSYARRVGLDLLPLEHVVRDSGGTWESEGEFDLTVGDGTYSFPTSVWDQDPNNGTPQDWTKALVESRRFGVEIA